MKMVLVEWNDSFFTHGWRGKDEFRDLGIAPCVSVGVVVSEDDNKITLVLSMGEENYADSMTIPKGCIKRIRRLKVNNK